MVKAVNLSEINFSLSLSWNVIAKKFSTLRNLVKKKSFFLQKFKSQWTFNGDKFSVVIRRRWQVIYVFIGKLCVSRGLRCEFLMFLKCFTTTKKKSTSCSIHGQQVYDFTQARVETVRMLNHVTNMLTQCFEFLTMMETGKLSSPTRE